MYSFPVQTYGRHSRGRIFNVKVWIKIRNHLSTLHAHVKITPPSIAQSYNSLKFSSDTPSRKKYLSRYPHKFIALSGDKCSYVHSRAKHTPYSDALIKLGKGRQCNMHVHDRYSVFHVVKHCKRRASLYKLMISILGGVSLKVNQKSETNSACPYVTTASSGMWCKRLSHEKL